MKTKSNKNLGIVAMLTALLISGSTIYAQKGGKPAPKDYSVVERVDLTSLQHFTQQKQHR